VIPPDLERLRALLDDRYEIERELGGGGMSRVYVALERALGRRVVVKVLAPELSQHVNIERFRQEIATSATLQHPQIVPVFHADAAGDLLYFVMPFIEGESLRHRLDRDGRLPALEVIRLLAPLARALAYAHRQGVVHRDVKPGNILLAEGEPMLTDFGIAKVVRDGGGGSGLTSAGLSIGTVTYMPPEQVTADPALDGRADVYSLAAVGYELLTGAPPFTGTLAQVMSAHVVQPVPPISQRSPGTPAALADVIMLGLEKSPDARPDAERFAALLDAASRTTGEQPARAPHRRGPSRMAMAVGASVLTLGGVIGWWWGTRGASVRSTAPVIAVLPFELIGAKDDAYLSAGVSDEITTALAQVPGLRVLSRATVRAFADSGFAPTDFGQRAAVTALVEGSVQRAGPTIRFTARLVDASDGSAIWSDRYERAEGDLFAAQKELGDAVGRALLSRFGLADSTARRNERVTDPQAYDLFLRGRYVLRDRGEAGLRTAMGHFSSAATRDPRFARAHAGIAEAAVLLPIYSAVLRETIEDTVRASARRAIALDSLLATPHVALGLLEKGLGRWAESERALTAALRLDSADASAHQNLGELYFTLGRVEDSRAALERATRLEPTDETIMSEFAFALLLAGDADSAARTVARASRAAASPFVAYTRAMVAERQNDAPLALRHMRDAATAAPLPFFRGALARAYWLAGDTAAALTIRSELRVSTASGATFGRVIASLPSGTADSLFADLERAADQRDPFVAMLPLRVWWYDRLRSDPRFAALAVRLGLPPASTGALPRTAR
jgi:serine/threonine-protein kinase